MVFIHKLRELQTNYTSYNQRLTTSFTSIDQFYFITSVIAKITLCLFDFVEMIEKERNDCLKFKVWKFVDVVLKLNVF